MIIKEKNDRHYRFMVNNDKIMTSKELNFMKCNKYVSVPLTVMLGLSLATYNVHAEKDKDNYFVVDITYPGKKAERYTSYEYSATNPLSLNKIKASKSNVKIKLVKSVRDGEEEDLDSLQLSYDYLNSSKHVDSLEANGKTLSLPASFLKASAYTTGDAKGRIAIREKGESPLEELDTNYILPVKETSYNKAIGETLSFAYLKHGLYGSKKKGIQLTKNATFVNNKSIAKRNFSWWTSEYKFINKQWRASSFILSLNYPFKYDETKTYSAYRFTINRSNKGYIRSMKLANVLTYTGSTIYGETWEKTSLEHRDSASIKMTDNWALGDTFKFKFIIKKPTITKIKAGEQSLTMNWKKRTDCDGFEIQYATNKNFDDALTYKISSYTATSATLNNLNSKSKYYVRMRCYGKVDDKTYYSSYSKIKSVKVK